MRPRGLAPAASLTHSDIEPLLAMAGEGPEAEVAKLR